jgi:hypothetical protein
MIVFSGGTSQYENAVVGIRGDDPRPAGTTFSAAADSGIDQPVMLSAFPQSKVVPSSQMQCRMTAILQASATLALFAPIRRFEIRPV